METRGPVFAYLPPAPIYVQLPPGVEQLISLIQENHTSQVEIYRQQQVLTNELTRLNNALERGVDDRHNQLRNIHARLDYLTAALQGLQGRQVDIEGTSDVESGSSRQPRSVTFLMPEPFIPPRPPIIQTRPFQHPVIPTTMSFDAPPVIPGTPEQKSRARLRRRRRRRHR